MSAANHGDWRRRGKTEEISFSLKAQIYADQRFISSRMENIKKKKIFKQQRLRYHKSS